MLGDLNLPSSPRPLRSNSVPSVLKIFRPGRNPPPTKKRGSQLRPLLLTEPPQSAIYGRSETPLNQRLDDESLPGCERRTPAISSEIPKEKAFSRKGTLRL